MALLLLHSFDDDDVYELDMVDPDMTELAHETAGRWYS